MPPGRNVYNKFKDTAVSMKIIDYFISTPDGIPEELKSTEKEKKYIFSFETTFFDKNKRCVVRGFYCTEKGVKEIHYFFDPDGEYPDTDESWNSSCYVLVLA